MSRIISFDVSSVSTGWAFLNNNRLKECGVIRPPDSFSLQEKLYYFDSIVNALLKVCSPDYILIEETYLKNVKTLKTLMQFIGILNYECIYECDLEPAFISPNTVRSHFCLKTKEDVFKAVKSKYKVKFKNIEFENGNDMADAIMQALYWIQILKEKDKKNE